MNRTLAFNQSSGVAQSSSTSCPSKLSNHIPFTRINHRAQTHKANKQATKNNTSIKRKALKEHTKGYARFYGYASARNAENGTRVETIGRLLSNN
jgi:hypothetical protein